MIARSVASKDDARGCYRCTIDFWGFPYEVEIYPAWKDDKRALEVRVTPEGGEPCK